MRGALAALALGACAQPAVTVPAPVPPSSPPPTALRPPNRATHVDIDYVYFSFHQSKRHYQLDWTGTAYRATGDGGERTIDAHWIEDLYTALTDLRPPGEDDLQCSSHTDDDPHFDIAIAGARKLHISSSSNCHAHVPWNVADGDRRAVQFTGALNRPVLALLAAVDPDHWTSPPNVPDAYTSLGGEEIYLGVYPGQALPTACARALEADPRLAQVLGAPPKLELIMLKCDLGVSRDCATTIADAQLLWRGFKVSLDLRCTPDGADLDAATAAHIAEVGRLLDAKPVHVLLALSPNPPSAVFDDYRDQWSFSAADSASPYVTYDRKTGTFDGYSFDQHGPSYADYWRALGIDARAITAPAPGGFTTSADLDADGHILKPKPSPPKQP